MSLQKKKKQLVAAALAALMAAGTTVPTLAVAASVVFAETETTDVFARWMPKRSSGHRRPNTTNPSTPATPQPSTPQTPSTPNPPSQSAKPVKLDTASVSIPNGGSYEFLVKDNADIANIKVEVTNPNVAKVVLENAGDPRGAKYRVTAIGTGSTEIKVTYQGQTTVMKVNLTAPKGSMTLDTKSYTLAPGGQYTIGSVFHDAAGNVLSSEQVKALIAQGKLTVRDSRTGSVTDLTQLPSGNFLVTAKHPGTTYIIYETGGTYASVRIDVQEGAQPHGTSSRNPSYYMN